MAYGESNGYTTDDVMNQTSKMIFIAKLKPPVRHPNLDTDSVLMLHKA